MLGGLAAPKLATAYPPVPPGLRRDGALVAGQASSSGQSTGQVQAPSPGASGPREFPQSEGPQVAYLETPVNFGLGVGGWTSEDAGHPP